MPQLLEHAFGGLRETHALALGKALSDLVEYPQIGFGFGVRRHHVAHQIDAALGIGEAAFLLAPHARGEIHVAVLVGLHVHVGVLHHQEFQLLQGLAYARAVGHGRHGIGGDDPQSFDLAGLYGRKDVGLEQAALLGKKFRVHTPEAADLFTVAGLFQRPIARQAGARRPLARTHGVALAGNGKRGTAGLADVAGDEIEIVDADHAVGTVGALVDAHGPDGHGGGGTGIGAGDVAYGVFVYAADARRRGRIVLLDQLRKFFVAVGMRLDILHVRQTFIQYHVRQAVEQHQVGAGGDGQMDIGHLREHGDARVHHN